jgi:signal transduction histidine kinase
LKRMWRSFYKSMEIMRGFRLGGSSDLNFPETSINEFEFMNKSLQMATTKAKQDYLLLKEFTENASHEMQTPLSIIRSKLDVLIQERDLSRKQSELVTDAYRSIRRLTNLNRSLLLLAKIENRQFDNKQLVNVTEKVQEKVNQFKELWGSHEIAFVSRIQEDITLTLDPELLEILLNNLFSNASNHNIAHGYIGIILSAGRFSISNTGDPSALDSQKLFTRFYKTSLTSNQNGLGLSIIKQITRVSGLGVHYEFRDQKHTFSITWAQI